MYALFCTWCSTVYLLMLNLSSWSKTWILDIETLMYFVFCFLWKCTIPASALQFLSLFLPKDVCQLYSQIDGCMMWKCVRRACQQCVNFYCGFFSQLLSKTVEPNTWSLLNELRGQERKWYFGNMCTNIKHMWGMNLL